MDRETDDVSNTHWDCNLKMVTMMHEHLNKEIHRLDYYLFQPSNPLDY